jgi:SAM-dependent methyltransferase
VSKGHDEPTRKPADRGSGSDGGMTPGPVHGVPSPGADGIVTAQVAAAASRRQRAGVPRERSGPIGIASGDFSTPTVRRRTTTQPRGVPVLDRAITPAPASAPEIPAVDPAAATLTPAPEAHAGRDVPQFSADPAASTLTPAPEAPEALGAQPQAFAGAPPPSPEDSPFASPRATVQADLDGEAAALAAEAAAVRALDSGPLTPPPELLTATTATPPPRIPTPQPETQVPTPSTSVDVEETPTPPPEIVNRKDGDAATSLSEALASVALAQDEVEESTPPPSDGIGSSDPTVPEPSFAVVPTPEPRVTPPPLAEPALEAEGTPAVAESTAPAVEFEEQPTPPPVVEPAPEPERTADAAQEVGGALPERAIESDTSDTNAEIPITLPAEALSDPSETPASAGAALGDGEGDESMEVVDGDETSGPIPAPPEAPNPPARAPILKSATPPPIPGSLLKVAGPDLVPSLPAATVNVPGATPPGVPILPEALAQRPRRPKRAKPWFEEVFDEDYLRTLPFMRPDQTVREVEFISDALRLAPGTELLDIGCGYGRHAIELVQRGFVVTGLDLSLPLLIRAADEAQRRALSVNFVHADMREMTFEKQFDGAYSMLTSFGYFDEESNLRVAERISRALKPGARFLLDVVNRDYVVGDLPTRVWWEGTGCVVLEEVDFNFHTSRIVTHRSIVFEDGRQLEHEISVRAYSLHEIGRLLRQAGFRVIDVSGGLATRGQFFGSSSRSLLVLAEKREDGAT